MNNKFLSMIKFSRIAMEKYGCVAVKYDLSKVWKTFAELPFDEDTRFILINDEIRAGQHYACVISLNKEKPSLRRRSARKANGIMAELLANYDSIISGEYLEKKQQQKKKAKKRTTSINSES